MCLVLMVCHSMHVPIYQIAAHHGCFQLQNQVHAVQHKDDIPDDYGTIDVQMVRASIQIVPMTQNDFILTMITTMMTTKMI